MQGEGRVDVDVENILTLANLLQALCNYLRMYYDKNYVDYEHMSDSKFMVKGTIVLN